MSSGLRAVPLGMGASLCGCILYIPLGDLPAEETTGGSGALWTTGLTEPPITSGQSDGGGVTGENGQTGTSGDESSTGAAPVTGTTTTTATTVSASTGESLEPPAIVEVDLTPNLIQSNGPVAVDVSAVHADGVTMVLDSGEQSELSQVAPGVFKGSFDVLTGFLNGVHVALLTPWRDAVIGEVVAAPYSTALPAPGSQVFWETSDELGPGQIMALGVLPDGQVVEFGTHFPNGLPRCYLRRRDKKGVVNATEFVLKDGDCTAVDLQVDDQGALLLLANRKGGDGLRWWYGRSDAWGLGVKPLDTGEKGETAVALAYHPSGMVAVCGYASTPAMDIDVTVKLFEANLDVPSPLAFDYQPEAKPAHGFDEEPQDCVFTGDTLALVGAVAGLHGSEQVKRDRAFILRVDSRGKSAAWAVRVPDVKTQSGAQAVAVDDAGRLVVAGYGCDDVCLPEGDLGIYDAENILKWQVSLGAFQSKDGGTSDLAWSPAGFAVVATGGLKGAESLFLVRAFGESQVAPLWTFTHKDIEALDMALALAVGRYGEVYAGGIGDDGYPAFACIGG